MRLLSSSCKRKKANRENSLQTTSETLQKGFTLLLKFRKKGDSKTSHGLGMEHTYIKLLITEYYDILKTVLQI